MLGSVLLQAAGTAHESFLQFLGENLELFLTYTGVYNATPGHLIMILVGLLFIFLAIKYEFEPMLLIPIGFGILIGNIPFKDAGLQVGIYEQGSVLNILYQGVTSGWYPPLIFLGIGAMTDFSLFKWDLNRTRPVQSVSSVVPTARQQSSFLPS